LAGNESEDRAATSGLSQGSDDDSDGEQAEDLPEETMLNDQV